jgi:hypothetical protein
MTAIQLLEKIGADASFDLNLLSEEDKKSIEQIVQKAQIFNAVQNILPPDEEEPEEQQDEQQSIS